MAPAVKRKFKNKKLTEPPKKASSFWIQGYYKHMELTNMTMLNHSFL
jgi:hypothetical protein